MQGFRIHEGPQALSQQTTVKAQTIDGVTKTVIYMAPPSGTPERDHLNPMAREQKRCVPSRLWLRSLYVVALFQSVADLHDQPTRIFAFQRVLFSAQQRE